MFIFFELALLQANIGELRSSYVDVESSVDNSFQAWISISPSWTQTLQSDFSAGVSSGVDVSTSPGDVKLSKQGSLYGLRGDNKYDFWRYNIDIDSWTLLKNTLGPVKEGGVLTHDGNNYIYALSGDKNLDFWRYSIASDNWTSMRNTPGTVSRGGALAFGGNDHIYALRGGKNLDFWRYSITANSWTPMCNTPTNVEDNGALAYDGKDHIYAVRGKNLNFWRYNISLDIWESLNSTPTEINEGGALAYANNYVYILRGKNLNLWRYNISSNMWDTMAALPQDAKEVAGLTYDGGNYLYAIAGNNDHLFYRYNISADSWTHLASTPAVPKLGDALAYVEVYKFNGTIASQVLDTGSSGMEWSSLEWNETLKAGTNITFEVRASDNSFAKEDSSPVWVSVRETSPVNFDLPSGRYMQWRATLTTTELSKTPVLHDVSVCYPG
ncbi:MAG: large repetitive protein [Euryarchaeota archaeon]|nr:large repetitive protein [Euryarchaeota archaeon]